MRRPLDHALLCVDTWICILFFEALARVLLICVGMLILVDKERVVQSKEYSPRLQ